MSLWLILVPFVSAIIGWLFTRLAVMLIFHPRLPIRIMGRTIQGIIPRRQQELAVSAGLVFSQELISYQEIEQKILHPGNLQKIMPEIEKHIDHFLRVKLKDAIPMVAMFVGDKTIIQLKEVFMTEMETLFPVIMESYFKELKKDIDMEAIITRKLASVPAIKIETFILKIFVEEFRYIQVAGAVLGFTIGVLQSTLTLFL